MLNTMIDVERIVPGGIVCLYTAWMHHQLCTTIPPAFCIAIEAKRKVVLPEELPINLYYWRKENMELGIEQKEISGFRVHITNLERSVCDAVKYRNKAGLDVCAEGMTKPIKNYGKSVKAKLLDLMTSSGYKYMYLLARNFNERLLYRVSVIPYRENFLLKGSSLLYALNGLGPSPTIDIDFMAQRISRDREHLENRMTCIGKRSRITAFF